MLIGAGEGTTEQSDGEKWKQQEKLIIDQIKIGRVLAELTSYEKI